MKQSVYFDAFKVGFHIHGDFEAFRHDEEQEWAEWASLRHSTFDPEFFTIVSVHVHAPFGRIFGVVHHAYPAAEMFAEA